MIKFVALLFCFAFTFSDVCAQDADAAFQEKLETLKAKDSLASWIDNRVNYAAAMPQKRLDFLMETNKLLWRNPKSQQEQEAWFFLLINEGYYQLQNGDILISIDCYEKAYQYYQKHHFDLSIEEYVLKPLSNNYTRLGDYERAIYIQNRSLNLALQQQNNGLAASVYCNLSTSYRSKSDLVQAEKSALSGIKLADKSSDIYGLLLSNMADIKNEKGDYSQASSYVLQAIKHLQSRKQNSSTSYWLLSAYTLAGDIELNKENYQASKLYYQSAQQAISKLLNGSRKRELSYVLTQLGKVELQQQNYQKALAYYNEALTLLLPNFKLSKAEDLPARASLYGENKLQAALLGKSEALSFLGKDKPSLNAAMLAFEVSEQLRTEFTYITSKEQLQSESKDLAEAVIEKAFRLWQSTKETVYAEDILMLSEKTKSRILFDELSANQNHIATKDSVLFKKKIDLERSVSYYQKQQQTANDQRIQNKIADLQFQLSTLQKQLNLKNPVLTASAKETLRKIPKNTKALMFFAGNKQTYLIVANSTAIEDIIVLGTTESIQQLVSHYLEAYFYKGPAAMTNNPQAFYETSFQIYQKLFAHIAIKGAKLLIVKDGLLNFLPFESLITKDGLASDLRKWPFFIRSVEIFYAFSINAIPSADPNAQLETSRFTGLFLSKTGSDKTEIPAVIAEYNALRKLVGGDFFKNEGATLSNFKEALSDADVLHVSSHSYLTESSKEPVLELFKDRFYLLELNSQTKVPKLVVLSACQTADGAYLSGEGVLSFSRGFIAAGSKGVISSLWNVNDQSAAKLMVSYYENLQQFETTSGMLAKTKLGWLNQTHENRMLLLPYYWDSLIYTGSDFKVALSKPSPYKMYLLFLISTLLLGAGGFYLIKKRN